MGSVPAKEKMMAALRKPTLKEQLDNNPTWVILKFCLVTGIAVGGIVFSATYYFLVEPLREKHQAPSTIAAPAINLETSPTPVTLTLPTPPTALTSPSRENVQMGYEEFRDQYKSLKGRFREREEFISRAHGKRISWTVAFTSPLSDSREVTLFFESSKTRPKDIERQIADTGSPVISAIFPLSAKDRVFALQPGDIIEIEGTLRGVGNNALVIDASDFRLVSTSR